MQDGILFDNILLAHEASVASSLATKTFVARKAVEAEAKKALSRGNLDTVPDDVIGKVKHYGLKTMYYAQDNPAVVGGSVLVGLVPLILLCCYGFGGSSEKKKPPPKKASAAKSDGAPGSSSDPVDEDEDEDEEEEEDDDDDDGIEEFEPEPEPKPSPSGAKKRTP